jgi:hypothetical protein
MSKENDDKAVSNRESHLCDACIGRQCYFSSSHRGQKSYACEYNTRASNKNRPEEKLSIGGNDSEKTEITQDLPLL